MWILRQLAKIKRLNLFLQKLLYRLHRRIYRYIGGLALYYNDGVHPKHDIMGYHDFFVDNIAEGLTVIDVGCGYGAVAYDVAERAEHVVGIDIDEERIAQARDEFARDNITYITADVHEYAFEQEFDYVVLSNVLEHFTDRIAFLQRLADLAPTILIRVPMLSRDWLPEYMSELDVEYFLDPDHEIEYTEATFREEMDRAGLQVKELTVRYGEIWAVVER